MHFEEFIISGLMEAGTVMSEFRVQNTESHLRNEFELIKTLKMKPLGNYLIKTSRT